ncbi:MAG: hypothetical protein COA58_13265 [Bacteroidetes bacterium]|nr:MAG: hypothetical protein COA58_13265 [Bacteroidota bacterium]
MNRYFYLLAFTLFHLSLLSQNCGSISSWSYTSSSAGGGNTQYTINLDAISTSGGDKGVHDIIISCGASAVNTNSTCFVTAPATGSPNSYSYSFTTTTCGSTLSLDYAGRTNNACGGTVCFSGSAGSPGSVPVMWLTTKAKCSGDQTIISWSTAQEFVNRGFEIQRQNSSGSWDSLGWESGAVNSNSIIKYSYSLAITEGIFRIKQIDFDGKFKYSKVFKSTCEIPKVNVFPNPVENVLHFSKTVNNVQISTLLGNTIFVHSPLTRTIRRPVHLAPGIYILKYRIADQFFTQKISFQ